MMKTFRTTAPDILEAATLLREGGVVAFPTETVYGLGADANNAEAVKRIFSIKGRPADHPLILHVASVWHLSPWVAGVSPVIWPLASRFWPGPLTMVMKRAASVPDAVTAGLETVAVRVPSHPAALALLHAFGSAIAAPSANLYGRTSPTTADHVLRQLGHRMDGLVDGGECHIGIESTILDVTGERACILRQGSITADMLADTLGYRPDCVARPEMRMPGSDNSHYAPLAPLVLAEGALDHALYTGDGPVHLLCFQSPPEVREGVIVHCLSENPEHYARHLYAVLHAIDAQSAGRIVAQLPPDRPEWSAIRDRLMRAAGGLVVDR